MNNQPNDITSLVSYLYKDESGVPIQLTDNQSTLFEMIASKRYSRIHCMSHTRWGKSMTVALAVLTRAISFPEKWVIVAGSREKAAIIMSYVNAHIFDHPMISELFIRQRGESDEEIKKHRNKTHITFNLGRAGKKGYSEILVSSAKDALGFGGQNIIEDEAALVSDVDHSLVMRMLGDKLTDNFLCKIGNPFERNHFLQSYHDPKYVKMVIDCYKSLEDGRITQDIIDENKSYSFFKVLFECKFPSATEITQDGWMVLLTDAELRAAYEREVIPTGQQILGIDVARSGRNYNAWVTRVNNYAKVLRKDLDSDLMSVGDTTVNLMRDNGIHDLNVYIDDSGVGGGLVDYLKSKGMKINAINFGGESTDKELLNARAEMYAGKEGLAAWIKQGGALEPHKDWIELTKIKHKKNFNGKTAIEPKEEMRKRGIESPDVADALALTFAKVKNSRYYGVDPASIIAGGVKPFYPGMPG